MYRTELGLGLITYCSFKTNHLKTCARMDKSSFQECFRRFSSYKLHAYDEGHLFFGLERWHGGRTLEVCNITQSYTRI